MNGQSEYETRGGMSADTFILTTEGALRIGSLGCGTCEGDTVEVDLNMLSPTGEIIPVSGIRCIGVRSTYRLEIANGISIRTTYGQKLEASRNGRWELQRNEDLSNGDLVKVVPMLLPRYSSNMRIASLARELKGDSRFSVSQDNSVKLVHTAASESDAEMLQLDLLMSYGIRSKRKGSNLSFRGASLAFLCDRSDIISKVRDLDGCTPNEISALVSIAANEEINTEPFAVRIVANDGVEKETMYTLMSGHHLCFVANGLSFAATGR